MAEAVVESLAREGLRVKLLSMNDAHRSEVLYEVLEAGALIVGSSTLNNNMLPQMADVMTYLKGLKPANLVGAAFGSFGWSGEAVKDLEAMLREMKVEIVSEPVSVKHVPSREVLEKCALLGRTVAAEVKKRISV
jgi:flavorubredoxin